MCSVTERQVRATQRAITLRSADIPLAGLAVMSSCMTRTLEGWGASRSEQRSDLWTAFLDFAVRATVDT